MKIVKLNLKKRSYKIVVGNKIIGLISRYIRRLNIGNAAYIVTNASIKNKYGEILKKALEKRGFSLRFKLIPDTEKSKSIEVAYSVIKGLTEFDKNKRIFIIALGGGVIGDLSGFVASIYKRGIPYIQVPTTLLAQVDSSIGGKTAVDLKEGKNLLGAFYQPKLVFSDINLLKTLDLRQIRSGLAEVIKYGIIEDPHLFSYLENNYRKIILRENSALEFIVWRCSMIKAEIIEEDEREEKGLRTILNFGHTIGHAIEAATSYRRYNHGEAIALGMLVATDLSAKLDLLSYKIVRRIEYLIESVGLPNKINKVTLDKIIKAYYRDKKFIAGKNRFVLIEDIGRTKIVEDIPLKLIKEVIKKRMN